MVPTEHSPDDQKGKPWKSIMGLDSIVHEPVRLALLLFLVPRSRAKFSDIQLALGMTAGNLSSHLKKLKQNGLIEIVKGFVDAKPTTVAILSDDGRKAILGYADVVSGILSNVLEERTEAPDDGRGKEGDSESSIQ